MLRSKITRSLFLSLVLAGHAPATWSIILVDTNTGEIAIGCATCIANVDLRRLVPVLRVGKGAAMAQSFVDPSGRNRGWISFALSKNQAPSLILAALAQADTGHPTRQHGIVDVSGRVAVFTGSGAFSYAGAVSGRIGKITYAIQGNILTGKAVLTAAETAVRTTQGDLASRLFAGMEAARAKGGDGRCSCSTGFPTGCGAPPKSFTKSAHTAFMIVARPGDRDGKSCNSNSGCVGGSYYMNLNVVGSSASRDPVRQLQSQLTNWRRSWNGRPDHFRSTWSLPNRAGLPADNQTTMLARLQLRDWSGKPLTTGGATVALRTTPKLVKVGTVRDNRDGSYSVRLTAGNIPGVASVVATVNDGKGTIQLAPLTVPVTNTKLWASRDTLSVGSGGRLNLRMNYGTPGQGANYLVLANISGTKPGFQIGGTRIPLNPDSVFSIVLQNLGQPTLPGLLGTLDASGRALATLVLPGNSYGLPAATNLRLLSVAWTPNLNISTPVAIELLR